MSENKKKYAYWMKPSMVEEITEMLDTANATSKSDFVCQAVQFYIGYLHQKKCIDYLIDKSFDVLISLDGNECYISNKSD